MKKSKQSETQAVLQDDMDNRDMAGGDRPQNTGKVPMNSYKVGLDKITKKQSFQTCPNCRS